MVRIKNLQKAAKRIKKAVKDNEKILIFSDADLDGVASLLIMEETLKSLGRENNLCYFPNQAKDGYGLNKKALSFLIKQGPGLLIIMDSGMSNAKEIEIAKKSGLETIIIDHHKPLKDIPKTALIVNPKQKGDKYPFKSLAACGVVFYVCREILGKQFSKNMEQNFLELTAIGTIADMMPVKEDNEVFIEKGVAFLPSSFRPGIRAFFDFFPVETFSSREIAQKIISVLHLTDFQGSFTENYLVLKAKSIEEAGDLIRLLIEKQTNRYELIMSFVEEIKERMEISPLPFIFDGGDEIPHILTGNIASKLCNRLNKPTFIFAEKDGVARGSVRAPKQVDCVSALGSCASLLEIYGGHHSAAGFTLKTKNIEKFKKCLENYFLKILNTKY